MNLEELKEALRKLSADDLADVKKFLDGEETETESAPVEEPKPDENKDTEANEKPTEEQEPATAEPAPDAEKPPVEEKPAEQPSEAESQVTDEKSAESTDEVLAEKPEEAANEKPAEEPNKETATPEQPAEAPAKLEPIPEMAKVPTAEKEQEAPTASIVDDKGETLPVDYEQVIDGLKAKNAALEAENTRLRAKVEGAFGFTAKASAPAKVNRLYDDCSDIQIHK